MSDAHTEIKKLWGILAVGQDSVLELRAIPPRGLPKELQPRVKHFRAARYPSVDSCKAAFEQEALTLNQDGYNVYTVMNPIRSDFSGPGAAKDPDIRYRDLLLIDIDRVGDTSVPADQAELDAAYRLALAVKTDMAKRGWPQPFMVMRGNGYHLYYVLHGVGNTPEAEAMVRGTLTGLAAAFDNDVVGIDTTVFNASRITKVPGTIMRKGAATEDRPHRMAVVCDEC
jgi:hypothetical protein